MQSGNPDHEEGREKLKELHNQLKAQYEEELPQLAASIVAKREEREQKEKSMEELLRNIFSSNWKNPYDDDVEVNDNGPYPASLRPMYQDSDSRPWGSKDYAISSVTQEPIKIETIYTVTLHSHQPLRIGRWQSLALHPCIVSGWELKSISYPFWANGTGQSKSATLHYTRVSGYGPVDEERLQDKLIKAGPIKRFFLTHFTRNSKECEAFKRGLHAWLPSSLGASGFKVSGKVYYFKKAAGNIFSHFTRHLMRRVLAFANAR